jgi:hypothetical protein
LKALEFPIFNWGFRRGFEYERTLNIHSALQIGAAREHESKEEIPFARQKNDLKET